MRRNRSGGLELERQVERPRRDPWRPQRRCALWSSYYHRFFGRVRPGDGLSSGLAPVSIVVHNDGRVESAALSSGPFFGTASGRCMEGVVRRARFPRFSQPSFRVQFPFAVQ